MLKHDKKNKGHVWYFNLVKKYKGRIYYPILQGEY